MQHYFPLLQDRPKNCYLRTHIVYRLNSSVFILSLGTSLPWKLKSEVSQSYKGQSCPRVTHQLCRLGEHRKLSNPSMTSLCSAQQQQHGPCIIWKGTPFTNIGFCCSWKTAIWIGSLNTELSTNYITHQQHFVNINFGSTVVLHAIMSQ